MGGRIWENAGGMEWTEPKELEFFRIRLPLPSSAALPWNGRSSLLAAMKPRIALHWQILAALILATLTALMLRLMVAPKAAGEGLEHFVSGVLNSSKFVGDLFMRALKMLIVPLIVTSVISGIANLQGVKGFARLGGKTAAFYLCSSAAAILLGLVLVNLIQPGLSGGQPNQVIAEAFATSRDNASEAELAKVEQAQQQDNSAMFEVFRSMLPENVISAAANNGQMLGVIVFSILFAVALTRIPGEEMQTMRHFFQSAHDAMIILTGWIMALAPIGIYALIFPVIYETGLELFKSLGKYFVTVLAALLIHLFVVLPLVLRWVAGVSPLEHFKSMRPALMLAFSTASSAGTLPVTMRCVEDRAGVPKRVSSVTLPLGATVNMDGTALYECVAVIFVAQVMGVELSFLSQLFIVVAALLTSIGVAGVPSASLVAILLILKSSQIPGAEAAALALLAVDRPLDMLRTSVNVFSDSCAAVVVAKSEEKLNAAPEPA